MNTGSRRGAKKGRENFLSWLLARTPTHISWRSIGAEKVNKKTKRVRFSSEAIGVPLLRSFADVM